MLQSSWLLATKLHTLILFQMLQVLRNLIRTPSDSVKCMHSNQERCTFGLKECGECAGIKTLRGNRPKPASCAIAGLCLLSLEIITFHAGTYCNAGPGSTSTRLVFHLKIFCDGGVELVQECKGGNPVGKWIP